jgi:hypothetical protein
MTANRLEEQNIQCPYCWQAITVLIDYSVESQEYIEDCEVCCRPIAFEVLVDDQDCSKVTVNSDGS